MHTRPISTFSDLYTTHELYIIATTAKYLASVLANDGTEAFCKEIDLLQSATPEDPHGYPSFLDLPCSFYTYCALFNAISIQRFQYPTKDLFAQSVMLDSTSDLIKLISRQSIYKTKFRLVSIYPTADDNTTPTSNDVRVITINMKDI